MREACFVRKGNRMNKYDEFIANINKKYQNMLKREQSISNVRVISATIAIILFILSVVDRNPSYFVALIVTCFFFLYLVMEHEKVHTKKRYLKAKQTVYKKKKARMNGEWYEFEDKGTDFLEEDAVVEKDLDVYGEQSLFQFMCCAYTEQGRKKFASYLNSKNCTFNRKNIESRQEAVREFIQKQETAVELETFCLMIGENSKLMKSDWYKSFFSFLKRRKNIAPSFLKKVAYILPIITSILLCYGMATRRQVPIVFFLLLAQGMIAYYVSYRYKSIIHNVVCFCSNIREYNDIIKYIERMEFSSEYLKILLSNMKSEYSVSKGIEKISRLDTMFSFQSNPYIHIILQIFFMYDIHCISALERWKVHYKDQVIELLSVVGEMEALISLASVSDSPMICFPEFLEQDTIALEVEEISHPLILSERAVSNSFRIQKETAIITGSNMSGKTTFMRTIGLNCILAYAGAPVYAKSMKVSYMKLYTSMRIQDDVTKGISSFYAEVLRIKKIVEGSLRKEPMLLLIDEIFKGTNSADRIIGATEIIKALNKPYMICLVSTHDFELCRLIEENHIRGKNYHFQEYYEKDTIRFDYKIRNGRCKTTNAMCILRMAGLIEP